MTYTRQTRARGWGEGTVSERADGIFQGRVYVTGADGRRVRKSFYGRTMKAVTEKMSEARGRAERGRTPTPARLSLAQFLAEWLEEKRADLRPATWSRYRQIIASDIVPTLGQNHVARLRVEQVNAALRGSAGRGLSPQTVNSIRGVLSAALHDAQRRGLVDQNAASLSRRMRVPYREMQYLQPDQVRRLLDSVRGEPIEPLLVVAATTGLRQGELFGLRWADLDLEAGTLQVRRAIQRVGGKALVVETKTNRSRRSLNLPPMAVAALRRQREWFQGQQRLAAGSQWQEQGLVFTTERGTPLDSPATTKRFQRCLARAGLPRIRFHDLRHTAASLLLYSGVDMRVVMEVMGHSQIGTTMNLYAHVLPAAKEAAAERMEALLVGGRP